MPYYLISTEWTGPKDANKPGHWTDEHTWTIQTVPGATNMSHEERIEGYLGTTNNWHEYAHGEFETLEAARAAMEAYAMEHGHRHIAPVETESHYLTPDMTDPVVETWTTATHETSYTASEWDQSLVGRNEAAGKTDAEIDALAEEWERIADADGIYLIDDVAEYLRGCRDDAAREAANA